MYNFAEKWTKQQTAKHDFLGRDIMVVFTKISEVHEVKFLFCKIDYMFSASFSGLTKPVKKISCWLAQVLLHFHSLFNYRKVSFLLTDELVPAAVITCKKCLNMWKYFKMRQSHVCEWQIWTNVCDWETESKQNV